jgi:hypothetical protein
MGSAPNPRGCGREVSVIKLDFMVDNLTWTAKGQILAAGIKGVQGDCPGGSGEPCIQGFEVAVIDPGKMQAKTVFDSYGKGEAYGSGSTEYRFYLRHEGKTK